MESSAGFRRLLWDFWPWQCAGIGQALQQNPDFPYYLSRNEQAIVHRFFSNWSRNRLLQAGFSLLGPYLSSSSLGVNDICSEGGSYKDS